MGIFNNFRLMVRGNTRLIRASMLVSMLSAVLPDIDHFIKRAFGVGEASGIWIDWPDRFLHDDFFNLAILLALIGTIALDLYWLQRGSKSLWVGVLSWTASIGILSHLFADLYIRIF